MGRSVDVLEFRDVLARIGTERLVSQCGLTEGESRRVMNGISEKLCSEYARCTIYIPVSYDLRNREIFSKFHKQGRASRACTAARVHELADDYDVSPRQIYTILRRERDAAVSMAKLEAPQPG